MHASITAQVLQCIGHYSLTNIAADELFAHIYILSCWSITFASIIIIIQFLLVICSWCSSFCCLCPESIFLICSWTFVGCVLRALNCRPIYSITSLSCYAFVKRWLFLLTGKWSYILNLCDSKEKFRTKENNEVEANQVFHFNPHHCHQRHLKRDLQPVSRCWKQTKFQSSSLIYNEAKLQIILMQIHYVYLKKK